MLPHFIINILGYVFILVISHLIGSLLVKIPAVEQTKGGKWYRAFVHCMIYLAPFVVFFKFFNWPLLIMFLLHFCLEMVKANGKAISPKRDEIFHYLILLVYFLWMLIIRM